MKLLLGVLFQRLQQLPQHVNAAITIQPATSIPGSTTIQVVSQNSNQTKTYTVSFVVVPAPTDAPNSPPD